MLRKELFVAGFVFAGSAAYAAWAVADEPVKPQTGAVKQRVSPKLLREALNLPEYQQQTAVAVPPVTLVDLQHLANRLKKSDDKEGAELLQRFINEHQSPVKQSALESTAAATTYNTQVEVVEVNLDNLSDDSILRNSQATSEELRVELQRLVQGKKARLLVNATVHTKANEASRYSDGGEFPVPVPGPGGSQTVEFREFGNVVEIMAIPMGKQRVHLGLTCEVSTKDMKHAIKISGVEVPGITKRRSQSTLEMNLGEWFVQSGIVSEPGHKLFMMARITPSAELSPAGANE